MSGIFDVARRTRAWACYDCGKCTGSCPLSRTGAPYSPRRHVLSAGLGDAQELSEDVFSCLTCKQCDERCPAQVDYTELILELRVLARHRTVEPQCPHGGALQSVMRMMASGVTTQNRLEWLDDGAEVEATTGSVFLWTGCTMYYDAFFPELAVDTLAGTRAALRLLNALGERPVVSRDERCCGHDLLWNGDRDSFAALARHNVALVAASGAEVLVVPCAECLRTWRVDYQPFFDSRMPQILHLSEYLADRLPGLQLADGGPHRLAFQDPCRLGRHLGVYDPPRQALQAVPGVELVEMARSRSRGLCCAGGSWTSCGRYSKQIQVDRLQEARRTGAELLVTACPKCQVHLRCAMRDPSRGEGLIIEIRDMAEILAGALVTESGTRGQGSGIRD